SIAGSDSGAGAGIQSDIKTFHNHGVYCVTVITAVTAQNTLGVQKSFELPVNIIDSQLKSVFDDFNVNAIKIGMLSSDRVIGTIVKNLTLYSPLTKEIKGLSRLSEAEREGCQIIIDPVILS